LVGYAEQEHAISSSLHDQVARLRRLDHKYEVFGASKHRYQSTPESLTSVERCEAALGVPLPSDYREFVLEVGSGAGPYYGLWTLDEARSEVQDLAVGTKPRPACPIDPAAAFPATAGGLREGGAENAAGKDVVSRAKRWPCSGCLPIGDQGCTFWSVLVLTGEFTGRVWDLACFEGFSGEWLPARLPPGLSGSRRGRYRLLSRFRRPTDHRELPRLSRPPTFREWYVGWAERCLIDFNN
jgi:hypothetical protein